MFHLVISEMSDYIWKIVISYPTINYVPTRLIFSVKLQCVILHLFNKFYDLTKDFFCTTVL